MKLRAYRENRGISIDQAASEMGLTTGYLSILERGLKWPGPFIIAKIVEWSSKAVTVRDIFDNLDMSLFAAKPIRVGKARGVKGPTPHGESRHAKKDHKASQRKK